MLMFAGSCAVLRDDEVQPGPLLPLLGPGPVARSRAGTPQGAENFLRWVEGRFVNEFCPYREETSVFGVG